MLCIGIISCYSIELKLIYDHETLHSVYGCSSVTSSVTLADHSFRLTTALIAYDASLDAFVELPWPIWLLFYHWKTEICYLPSHLKLLCVLLTIWEGFSLLIFTTDPCMNYSLRQTFYSINAPNDKNKSMIMCCMSFCLHYVFIHFVQSGRF